MHTPLSSLPKSLRRTSVSLGMLHYHLKSGGVVSVMRDIAFALCRYGRFSRIHFDIFSAAGPTEAASVFDLSDDLSCSSRLASVLALAYQAQPYPDRATFLREADELARQVLDQIDLRGLSEHNPYILIAQNISLGKNPAATMAFLRLSELAMEQDLPMWLVNHVHDFAENNRPEQLKAFFTCTGQYDPAFARSFMYPNRRNIFYLTINSGDVENLRTLGIGADRIFLLPDPVDTEKLEQRPIWEENEWKKEGLPPADYREDLLQKLKEFGEATSQLFRPELPILLSPMKVMRRKNNLESLLLLILHARLGRRFQLLISLDANSPADIEYSRQLKQLASSLRLPVVVGFGQQLVSRGKERLIKNDRIRLFTLADAIGLCKALLTTSILEGFGLVYHEGWLCERPVIGRKIPGIVRDFEDNGMDFSHMYDRLSVPSSTIRNLREVLLKAYAAWYARLEKGFPISSLQDILNEKTYKSDRIECIDFADLGVEAQIDMVRRCAREPDMAEQVLRLNPAIEETAKLLDDCPMRLIEKNADVARTQYSLEAMARRLEHLFEIGDSKYRERYDPAELRAEDHMAVIEKYRRPENVRLLLIEELTGRDEREGAK